MRENDKILVQNIAVFIHINIVFFYLCILNNIVYSSWYGYGEILGNIDNLDYQDFKNIINEAL